MLSDNLITATDSYKWSHPNMIEPGVTNEYFYYEARTGAGYPKTLWVGLQYILKRYLEGSRVRQEHLDEALGIDSWHFAQPQLESIAARGWSRIIEHHGGRLPILIRAAPEGLLIDRGNVLLTIESTDPQIPWIGGHLESILEKVWYPTTVATVSWHARAMLEFLARETSDQSAEYMLHDFGYRGSSSEESARVAGGVHLFNFRGTDTIEGMRWLREYYGAPAGMAHSVAASQHSIMTSRGAAGEHDLAKKLIVMHGNQILSLVADSYDYYRFVDAMIDARPVVTNNSVRLVVRPDSVTPTHKTPEEVVLWTLKRFEERMGATTNAKGFKVLPYGILWGDGLTADAIEKIARTAAVHGYALPENLVFGMGGGLHQKGIDRDTLRFAAKLSAQERGKDGWVDIQKNPLDHTKASKAGRLALKYASTHYFTERENGHPNLLRQVFRNGLVLHQDNYETVRGRAERALKDQFRFAEVMAK